MFSVDATTEKSGNATINNHNGFVRLRARKQRAKKKLKKRGERKRPSSLPTGVLSFLLAARFFYFFVRCKNKAAFSNSSGVMWTLFDRRYDHDNVL